MIKNKELIIVFFVATLIASILLFVKFNLNKVDDSYVLKIGSTKISQADYDMLSQYMKIVYKDDKNLSITDMVIKEELYKQYLYSNDIKFDKVNAEKSVENLKTLNEELYNFIKKYPLSKEHFIDMAVFYDYINSSIKVTDEAVKEYYNNNKDSFIKNLTIEYEDKKDNKTYKVNLIDFLNKYPKVSLSMIKSNNITDVYIKNLTDKQYFSLDESKSSIKNYLFALNKEQLLASIYDKMYNKSKIINKLKKN